MTEWVKVAEMSELRRRRRTRVEVDGEPVALFCVEDRVYALADGCVHQGRSLSRGTVFRGRVVCPGHQWQVDLDTGTVVDQDECQPTYAVRVEDGAVHVSARPRAAAGTPAAAGEGAPGDRHRSPREQERA